MKGYSSKILKILTILPVLILLTSCGQQQRIVIYPNYPKTGKCKYTYRIKGKTYCVRENAYGFVQVGIASWYGPGFHGSRTASGEIYDMYKFTAAHKTLPLGTYVKVINLENGRSVVVKINDRGPFVKGRIIDLSYAAAKKLGMLKKGTALVKIIALGKRNYNFGRFYVQIGAFKNKFNAYSFRWKVQKCYEIKTKVIKMKGFYRVLAGPVKSYRSAENLKRKLKSKGLKGSFILRL
jgi:rare lipoprotein A